MNDRLQEIAEQASKEAFPVGSMAWMEKFAEMIVRECIGCCEQVISDPVPNYYIDTWLNGGLQCIDEIKEHFGVE